MTASLPSAAAYHGWQTNRHKYFPTTDLPLYTIRNHSVQTSSGDRADLVEWLNHSVVEGRVFPLIRRHYSVPLNQELYMQDAFIVKYDAATPGAQTHLSTHQDSSLFSFTIALSSPAALSSRSRRRVDSFTPPESEQPFEGGGTHLTLLDEVLRPRKGSLVLHPSRVYHAGASITAGRRYLLVGFVQLRGTPWTWEWRRFGRLARCMAVQRYALREGNGNGTTWQETKEGE
jgi:hypothetical protein